MGKGDISPEKAELFELHPKRDEVIAEAENIDVQSEIANMENETA